MRSFRLLAVLVPIALVLGACDALTGPFTDPDAPTNLTYELIPSGDPNVYYCSPATEDSTSSWLKGGG